MRHFHDDDDDELFDLFMMDEMDREDARRKKADRQKSHFPDPKRNSSQENGLFGLFRKNRRH